MSVVIQVDTSNLKDILRKMRSRAKSETHRALSYNLTRHSNILAKKLNDAAPSQWRSDDARYKSKLNESFFAVNSGNDTRSVMTTEPKKLGLVSVDTRQHEIRPRFKKALWWPGLERPIAYVANHPGTTANNFVEETLDKIGLTPDPQMVADMIATELLNDNPGSAWNYYGQQTSDFSEWGGPTYD